MDSFSIDNLLDSMVKIVGPDEENIEGSGFMIRSDGYLITCHHVIYPLNDLKVSYRENIYRAKWCEELSDIETDIAVLKIDIQDAVPVTIVKPKPEDLSGEVVVVGFPHSKSVNFPRGFDFHSQNIQPSTLISTLSTYNSLNETKYFNSWNKLPLKKSTFRSFRIDTEIHLGASGGPVFIEGLGGVVGLIQSRKGNSGYVIRWDNIPTALKSLGLTPKKSTSNVNPLRAEKPSSTQSINTQRPNKTRRWIFFGFIVSLGLVGVLLFTINIHEEVRVGRSSGDSINNIGEPVKIPKQNKKKVLPTEKSKERMLLKKVVTQKTQKPNSSRGVLKTPLSKEERKKELEQYYVINITKAVRTSPRDGHIYFDIAFKGRETDAQPINVIAINLTREGGKLLPYILLGCETTLKFDKINEYKNVELGDEYNPCHLAGVDGINPAKKAYLLYMFEEDFNKFKKLAYDKRYSTIFSKFRYRDIVYKASNIVDVNDAW